MKAAIVAGGRATRLRPLSYHRPKALLPICNIPYIELQLRYLKRWGVDEVVFCTDYLAEQLVEFLGDGESLGMAISYSKENIPLDTAGAVINAREKLGEGDIFVLNGDVITDFPLDEALSKHKERNAEATLILASVQPPHAYGVVRLEEDGRVAEFVEPSVEAKQALARGETLTPTDGPPDLINAGIYILNTSVFTDYEVGQRASFERLVFPKLIADNAGIYGQPVQGFWLDIGKPKDLIAANQAVSLGKLQVFFGDEKGGSGAISQRAHVDATANITQGSVIGPGCSVGPGVSVQASVLYSNITVESGVQLDGCLIDDDVTIGAQVVLGPGTVIGRSSVIRLGGRS